MVEKIYWKATVYGGRMITHLAYYVFMYKYIVYNSMHTTMEIIENQVITIIGLIHKSR